MQKFHLLILAIIFSVSSYSQTTLSFTQCISPGLNNTQDITSDTNNVAYITYTLSGSMTGISKSVDNGITFTYIAGNNPLEIIALGTPGAVKLFSSTKKSTDGGLTWTAHTLFPTGTGENPKFLKINNLTAYYYGVLNSFKTIDGGITWVTTTSPPYTVTIGGLTHNYYYRNFYLGNNDIYFGYILSTQVYFLNSKDFGATFSYSLNATNGSEFVGSLLNFNNPSNFMLFSNSGQIVEFPLNSNSTTPSSTMITYSIVGVGTVPNFGKSVTVNNYFLIIDNKGGAGSTNGILRLAIPTSTTSVGLNELSKNSTNIYPNPCINKLNITGVNKVTNYSIINQLGQLVLSGLTYDYINTELLMPGIYFLSLNNAKPTKFIKE